MRKKVKQEEGSIWETVQMYLNPIVDSKHNYASASAVLWCKTHKYGWQFGVDDHSAIHIYDEFPSIGLERKDCPRCEGKIVRIIRDADDY